MKKTLYIISVILLAFTITACGTKKSEKNTKKELITIDFDTDGGNEIESIKVEKNTSITLPTTSKEGYNFIGWYDDTNMVTNETKFTKNTKLVAKWDKIPENAKTFTIVFDTKGGNEINGLTLECDKKIKLPANPTRKGYKFVNWTDNNGKVISDGALLACEDITITANWKEEKEESNSNSNKTITYVCEKGYTQEGKICKKTVDAEKICPNGTYEYGDICITVTTKSRTNPISESTNCASKNYVYIASPSDYNKTDTIEAGCFPKTNKVSYCKDGELNSGKCYIEVNAKKVEK